MVMALPGELSENSEKLCSEVFARAVLASLGEADTRTSTRSRARVATARRAGIGLLYWYLLHAHTAMGRAGGSNTSIRELSAQTVLREA